MTELIAQIEQYNEMVDSFTEYELSVLEDIIEFGQQQGKTRGECLDEIESLTEQYWSASLGDA